jgi:hypothetical protein
MKTTTLAIAAAMAAGTLAHAQEAVQWRVEDGGNGHWYQRVESPGTWDHARSEANALGGHLATMTSPGEQQFITGLGAALYWLGGFAPPNQGCGPAAWMWVTGEPMSHLGWAPGEPGTCSHTCMQFAVWGGYTGGWNNQICSEASTPGYMLEWSADCNGDGIVDYGQILDGTFEDANENGVPDACECFADVNQDGIVNGADISAVLGFWGLAGKPLPAADITRDGIVDGADLAVLLGSWGECP